MIIKRKIKTYYFISPNPNLDGEILKPSIPVNFLTKGKFEDFKLPRILLYESIDDALSGGQFLGQNLKDMKLTVYKAMGIRKDNLLTPSIDQVPYKLVLNEFWYCINLMIRKEKDIKVDDKKETLVYHYGPRSTKAELYKWSWHDILKPWEMK